MSTTQSIQQPTSDIATVSAYLHKYTSWQTIHSLTFDHLSLLTTLSVHHKIKTTRFHFTKTIKTIKRPIGQHVEHLIFYRLHSVNVHGANKHLLIKAILYADKLFIFKGNHNSTNHNHLPMYILSVTVIELGCFFFSTQQHYDAFETN